MLNRFQESHAGGAYRRLVIIIPILSSRRSRGTSHAAVPRSEVLAIVDLEGTLSRSSAYRHDHASGGGYGHWNQGIDEPLPLETIPSLVISEIMRDVDLFVGVASVGNDPNWSDGGPGGRYHDYWQSYSFGELSATAQTRRVLLERLIPRLKIATCCTLTERFLVVRGELRTYKIHLGSGNILMSPNDQYLCIVPKQTTAGHERVFLPFEGDATLSVILSKAFLLADDSKITDPTITSQLKK